MLFISLSLRNWTLANEAPIWMCRDGGFDLILAILRLLLLIESQNVSLPFALMLLAVAHDVLILNISEKDRLTQWYTFPVLRIEGHYLL